jgi:hypothetical protein
MSWVLVVITVWLVVALVTAVVIGSAIRLADHKARAALRRSLPLDTWPADAALPRPAPPADDEPWRAFDRERGIA